MIQRGTVNNFLVLIQCCFLSYALLLLNGCTNSTGYVEETIEFSKNLTAELEAELEDETLNDTVNLSFNQACLEAARVDRDIASILEKLKQAGVEADGVSTYLWPRLNLGANSEIPLSNTDENDFELNAGLYLNYDIRRAIAVNDESVLRMAVVDQNRFKLNLAVSMLQRKLKNHLYQISLLTYKAEKKSQALALSRDAYSLAKVYADQKRLNSIALASWRKKTGGLEVELAAIRNQLKAEQYTVSDLLGRKVGPPVVITDMASILSENTNLPVIEYSPSEIWNKHSEARLYELELIAAEAGAQLVALERLPKLDAVFGLGDIPLDSSEFNSSSLLRLTFSMPLYDFGDHSRKVIQSQITRDRARRSMKSNMIRLINRVQLAKAAYLIAQDNLTQTMSAVENTRQLIAQKNILISETRGDNLGLYPDKINLLDFEILQQEAATAVRKTADDLRFAAGDAIVAHTSDDLIKTLSE